MYDILVIGSGISSKIFLSKLKKKGKKIAVISAENVKTIKRKKNKLLEEYVAKNLPPRFKKKSEFSSVLNFFLKNKILINKDVSIFGYLNKGGVSNYWGGSCEFLTKKNINFLNEKNKKDLINSFKEIYSKYNFTGEMYGKYSLNTNTGLNHIKLDPLYNDIIKNQSDKRIQFFENCIASNYKTGQILKPKHITSNYSKSVKKYNYFVNNIEKNKNSYLVNCENGNKKISIKSKKIVLAAGTISSTRLICKMLNIRKPLIVDHNPMMFGLFFLKRKIKSENFSSSKLAAKIFSKNKKIHCSVNFRSSNYTIRKKIFDIFPQIKNSLSKSIYNILQNRMIFINLYLDSKYGNLSFCLNKEGQINLIRNKKKMKAIKKELNNNFKILKDYLSKKNIIYPLSFKFLPIIGNDNHYTGTIPINGNNKKLSLNTNCELKSLKNIYIIDGSAIPKNKSKFPTALIMSNAHRIGLNFK